jgi:hypothetical protein
MDEMYKKAARMKVRFDWVRGRLSIEDLYDLTVEQMDEIYGDLKDCEESHRHSLLKERTKEDELLELKIALVKDAIETRQAEAEAAESRVARAAEKQKWLDLLERKEDEEKAELSADEIRAKIEELS